MLGGQSKSILLFFGEPGCGACEAAMPEVAQWQREYRDSLRIIPISRGEAKANRAKSTAANLRDMLLQNDREVSGAYRVEGTPAGVLVRGGLVASPVATGIDAIRGLVAQATLPPPVNKGDAVPPLKLVDLNGKSLDLSKLKSHRSLILFWNPSCGYCQQMLEDIKAWERAPQEGAPELLIISSGALEDNRKHGFRSPVLLDPYHAASRVFNSGGTPSAVLIETGRVASEVGVGALSVLAMARSDSMATSQRS